MLVIGAKGGEMDAALFVRLPGVIKMTGLGRSTIYRLMAKQEFPAPVKLSTRAVAWKASELGQWCESRQRGVQRD